MAYVKNPEVIHSKIGDEVVLLNIKSGMYFGMNQVASAIWEILAKQSTMEMIIEELMKQFEVDRVTCESQTKELLENLIEKKLIYSDL